MENMKEIQTQDIQELNEKTSAAQSTKKGNFFNTFLIQFLCQCILWSQFSFPTQSYAAEEVTTVESLNEVKTENSTSQANLGALTKCTTERSAYESYTDMQNDFTNYASSLSSDISSFIGNADTNLSNLIQQQSQFYQTDMGFVNPTDAIDNNYQTVRARWTAAQEGLVAAREGVIVAEQQLQTALSRCDHGNDNDWCSPEELADIAQARRNLSAAQGTLAAAQAEYNAARSAWRGLPANVNNSADAAVSGTAGNANNMAGTHSVSGCGSNFDITTNVDTDCALSGPLFEADTALTEIVNRNVADAKALAAERERVLFELELQQKYDADYKLYRLAVNNVTGQTQGYDANGDGDYDDTELGEYTSKNRVGGALEVSNIKTMSLASASIRNMTCEKHDISESDPQSYYLFRAAMATWLTAVVNDTDYYNAESTCMSEEQITTDTDNEQLQTIERATNLTERQLKSLCLRSRPKPSDVIDVEDPEFLNDANPDGWKRFGIVRSTIAEAKAESIAYAVNLNKVILGYTEPDTGKTYPPLSVRCDEYLQKIIGPDYDPDQARTREYAAEMIQEALGVAVEELAAKRKKLGIAHANVIKGQEWVKRVERDIMIMTILAAAVYAAYQIAKGICSSPYGQWACPIAAALYSKWIYITLTVIAIWLMSELARAKSFLAKWKKKREIAKYFSHMACNFEDAAAEEDEIKNLGQLYQDKRNQAMEQAEDAAINKINHILYEEISGNTVRNNSSTMNKATDDLKKTITKLNKKIAGAKSVKEMQKTLSQSLFQTEDRWEDVLSILSLLGVSVIVHALPGDEAIAAEVSQEEIFNTTNALNIQTGTGNFKYFLTQRNQHFQNITNDITMQPNHSPSNSEIANGGKKNVSNQVIISVDQLAAPFIGGDGHDPLEDIKPEQYKGSDAASYNDDEKVALMKTGFATPETRVVTINNALQMLLDNLSQLQFATAIAGYNLDQYVSYLDTARKEMEIEDDGLGNVVAETVNAPISSCLKNTTDGLVDVDPTCTCRAANSCASYSYPTYNIDVPDALKNGNSSIKTANEVVSGNLKGANVAAGSLMQNAGRVRQLIDDATNNSKYNSKTGRGSNGLNNGLENANALNRANESKVNGTLAKIGDDPNSAFNEMRRNMSKNGLSGVGSNSSDSANKDKESKENDPNASAAVAGTEGAKGSSVGNGKKKGDSTTSESFSLGGGNTNLNLQGLSDEEKRRLGLLDDGLKNDDVVAINSDGLGHQRNINGSSSEQASSDSTGINQDRKKSIFTIISNRYEKSAYPVLLNKMILNTK